MTSESAQLVDRATSPILMQPTEMSPSSHNATPPCSPSPPTPPPDALQEMPIPLARHGAGPLPPIGTMEQSSLYGSGALSRARSVTPLGITAESPVNINLLQKRVSFQNLNQNDGEEEESSRRTPQPRPLPPIGSTPSHQHVDDFPGQRSRRLPPLHGQSSDALSLYSASSQSQLFSQLGSTNSLPLPDPRYSSSNTLTQALPRQAGRKKKQAKRHSVASDVGHRNVKSTSPPPHHRTTSPPQLTQDTLPSSSPLSEC